MNVALPLSYGEGDACHVKDNTDGQLVAPFLLERMRQVMTECLAFMVPGAELMSPQEERNKANNEVTRQSNLDSGHIFFRLVSLVAAVQTKFVLVSHLIETIVHM